MPQILIVDDELLVAKYVAHLLNELGYETHTASSAEEAIDKAGTILPDLVLMDVFLKGEMNGVEAAHVLWRRFNIPVVYVTGGPEKDLLRANITGCLTKPFDKIDLEIVVGFALKRAKSKEFREAA
jgi:CheY-like chemotaxis protein